MKGSKRQYGPLENLVLTDAELQACHPLKAPSATYARAYCPYHRSDHQRSLRVNLTTGNFRCFRCEAWGYLDRGRRKRSRARQTNVSLGAFAYQSHIRDLSRADLAARTCLLDKAQWNLRLGLFSAARAYLHTRGISADLAMEYGVGSLSADGWPNPRRGGYSRLVFPHTMPDGELVSLYGRAIPASIPQCDVRNFFRPQVEDYEDVPKQFRHDHLPGAKGYFNAASIGESMGPLVVCEGVFDALSLIAAGVSRVVAIFGLAGWRWEWALGVRELVLAFDADDPGQRRARELSREGAIRGKRVSVLPIEAYAGFKDINAAWAAGELDLPEELLPREPEAIAPQYRELPRRWKSWPPAWREQFEQCAASLEIEDRWRRDRAEAEAERLIRAAHRKDWEERTAPPRK